MLAGRNIDQPMPITGVMFLRSIPERLALSLTYAQGAFDADKSFLPMTLAMLAAPVLLGLHVRRRALIPLGIATAIYLGAPHFAFETFFIYERFAMFLLPFAALALVAGQPAATPISNRARWGMAGLVVACWASLGLHAVRLAAFAREAGDFEMVLAAAEPARRALSIVTDRTSAATGNPLAYTHHASWYQADKSGFVVCNFAIHHPQVVRYRPGQTPRADECLGEEVPFDWQRHDARLYDYYFVRHDGSGPPAALTGNGQCAIRPVKSAGKWMLLERGACTAGAR